MTVDYGPWCMATSQLSEWDDRGRESFFHAALGYQRGGDPTVIRIEKDTISESTDAATIQYFGYPMLIISVLYRIHPYTLK